MAQNSSRSMLKDWNTPGCPKEIEKKLLWAISLSSTDSPALLQAEVLELIFYALHYERRYVFNQRMHKEGEKKKTFSNTRQSYRKYFQFIHKKNPSASNRKLELEENAGYPY